MKTIEKNKEKGKNRKRKMFVFLILLILLVLGIVVAILFWQRRNCTVSNEQAGAGVGLVIDPDAKSSPLPEDNSTAEQDVAISGRGSMTIPADKREVTVDFYNPVENEGMYYLTFTLRIYDDSGQRFEELYQSGLVEPGKHIKKITLSRGLKEGVYKAVVHVQPFRMNEEKTLTNNADMKIRLIVK